MRDFLSNVVRAISLSITAILLIASVSTTPALAQRTPAERSSTSTPPSVEASGSTNASSLRSTSPSQTESEFKSPPHVYDMKSIREFDRQVYQTREQQAQRAGDRTSR